MELLTRALQHAIESYTRAISAQKEGRFTNEIVPITVPGKRGESTTISEDDEPKNANISKMSTLKTAFIKDGTVTAANSSKLNDGASALILMSAAKAKQLGLKPLARVRGFADAAHAPIEFPTAPAKAIPLALKHAGVTQSQVDYWEINQAFSVVSLANIKVSLTLCTLRALCALCSPRCADSRAVDELGSIAR
jgi:acetyl-CoA C-acetyltransferase